MTDYQKLAFLQLVTGLGLLTIAVCALTGFLESELGSRLGERFDRLGERIFPPRDVL